MDSTTYLHLLRRDLTAFGALIGGNLDAKVEHCGDWTLFDLAEHVGTSNLWVAKAVAELRGDYDPPPAPRDPGAVPDWFQHTADTVLAALDTDAATEAWTLGSAPSRTAGFWHRRWSIEAHLHRWDAENAIGTPTALDAHLSGDGIAEVFDFFAPRLLAAGSTTEPAYAIRLRARDIDTTWTHGPGEPVATITATAEQLLLMLWGRMPRDTEAFSWDGDRDAGERLLAGPLVP